MTITEPARHQLYRKLEEALGMDEAATLMAHLPPVGWADVATKRDLDNLHDRIRVEMAELRVDLHRDRIAAQRQLLFVLAVAFISLLATVATSL